MHTERLALQLTCEHSLERSRTNSPHESQPVALSTGLGSLCVYNNSNSNSNNNKLAKLEWAFVATTYQPTYQSLVSVQSIHLDSQPIAAQLSSELDGARSASLFAAS